MTVHAGDVDNDVINDAQDDSMQVDKIYVDVNNDLNDLWRSTKMTLTSTTMQIWRLCRSTVWRCTVHRLVIVERSSLEDLIADETATTGWTTLSFKVCIWRGMINGRLATVSEAASRFPTINARCKWNCLSLTARACESLQSCQITTQSCCIISASCHSNSIVSDAS